VPARRPADRAAARPAGGAEAALAAILTAALAADGFDLEEVTVVPAGRRSVVRVVVDREGGLDLDAVAEASRAAGAALDAADADDGEGSLLPGAYTLEVTSPGVDRPLTLPRHWRRNVGRLVTVVPRGGTAVTGRVLSAGDDAAVLAVRDEQREVRYDEVASAAVEVEFARSGDAGGEDA